MMVAVISWCIHMRGPLFASVFSPLMLVMVALAGCTMLNEKLHLGRYIYTRSSNHFFHSIKMCCCCLIVIINFSIIGAVLIVCGLYVVLWGKSKEMKKINQLVPSESSLEQEEIVQIVVTCAVDDKSNHNDNNAQVVTNNEEQTEHVHNQVKEGGQEISPSNAL